MLNQKLQPRKQLIDKIGTSFDKNFLESVNLLKETIQSNKKVLFVGNGGSAAMASHVAIDFTKSARIRATNYNEADLLTCFSNDFGYENWVSKTLEFYADKGDTVILISSSGKSKNIINGAKKAQELDLPILSLTGFKENNEIKERSYINFWADSEAFFFIYAFR